MLSFSNSDLREPIDEFFERIESTTFQGEEIECTAQLKTAAVEA
jgi:hypothetical protein